MGFRSKPLDDEFLRVRIVFLLMLLGLCLLGAGMWRIQVAHGERYENKQAMQSIRRVRTPGVRGRLFDRNEKCLADNRPSYCVAVYLEELRRPGAWSKTIDRVEELIAALSVELNLPPTITRKDIQAHIRKRLPLPLVLWRDIDEERLARLSESESKFSGVDIYPEAVRFYPENRLACHLLGYIGRADISQEDNDEEPYDYYLPEMTGRSGVEKSLDTYLRGEAGGRLVRIDVSGYRRDDVGQRDPRPGSDIRLALDAGIQRMAEDALGDVAGAVVVLDPGNGDVLALASSPGYDPNKFIPFITTENWTQLNENPMKPLINRAVTGLYPPGSTFKPITAMAALENGKARPGETHDCPGHFQLGSTVFRCWFHAGHGVLDLRGALQHSCNVYFFNMGLACGHEAIAHMAAALGLGRKSDIELDYERAGLVPDERWKRMTFNDGWRDGDTCNMSIGQGALQVTPLQMAVVTAAIANGGLVYRPRLVLGVRDPGQETFIERPAEVVNDMHWAPENIRAVREGMRAVVMTPNGTGRAIQVPGVTVAGKTGTAEFGRKDERKRHAWMIAFAPYEAPRYAVVMLVDEGISGSETAAPRMRRLMHGLFRVDTVASADGGQG